MKILKKVGDLLSPNDPELVEKTLLRLEEQDHWNDVFSTKLIELLDTNEALKKSAREATKALEEAKTLAAKAEIHFGDASRTMHAAKASLEVAIEHEGRALGDYQRASKLYKTIAPRLVIGVGGLCVFLVLFQAFVQNFAWTRPIAFILSVFISIAVILLIRRMRNAS